MILPKEASHAAFQIGERKFALFFSLAFVEVEDSDEISGIMFRPGEVSCVVHKPDGEEPFDLSTAFLQPTLIPAENIEDAALSISKEILAVGDRILDAQVDRSDDSGVWNSPEADALMEGMQKAHAGCCGGHCQADKDDAVTEQPIQPDEKA